MGSETLPHNEPEEPEQSSIANASADSANSDEKVQEPPAAYRLRSGMPLDEIARIGNPEHRAMALYSSGASRTDHRMIKLAASVAVPEAGEWGRLVQTLLVPPAPKPKRVSQKKEPRSVEGQPNLWLEFAELSVEQAFAPAPQDVPEMTSTAPAADDVVVADDVPSKPIASVTTA